jgi:hypothetical protein
VRPYTDFVTRRNADNTISAVPGATVTVLTVPGGVPATIYSDDGVTTKANPFTADASGGFTFYAADGIYDIQTSFTGLTTEIRRENFYDCQTLGIGANLGNMFGRNKNYIDNPRLDLYQRGTSQTSNGYGTFDRFVHSNSGTTKTTSVQAFAPGDASVDSSLFNFRRTVVTSVAGAGNLCITEHHLEFVRMYSSKTQTFTFWAKADASRQIAIEFAQTFGSTGSAAVTGISVQKFSLTTSWQKFTAVVNWPSISGKTISGGNDYAGVLLWMDAGSSFNSRTLSLGQQSGTFDDAAWQLEDGGVATSFEARPIAIELLRCQRFYEIGGPIQMNQYGATSGSAVMFYSFKVSKRVIPTMTSSPSVQTNCSGTTTVNITTDGFGWSTTVTALGGFAALGTWTASADI